MSEADSPTDTDAQDTYDRLGPIVDGVRLGKPGAFEALVDRFRDHSDVYAAAVVYELADEETEGDGVARDEDSPRRIDLSAKGLTESLSGEVMRMARKTGAEVEVIEGEHIGTVIEMEP